MTRRSILTGSALGDAGSFKAAPENESAAVPAWILAALAKSVFRQGEEVILTMTRFILSDGIKTIGGAPGQAYHLHFRSFPAIESPRPQAPYVFTMVREETLQTGHIDHQILKLNQLFELTLPGLYSVYATRLLTLDISLGSNEVFFRILDREPA